MACEVKNIKKHKKIERKVKKVRNNLEPGWVAPDGGWGWVMVVAAGLSNVFILAFCVSFGLIFRDRLQQYGISTFQTTTIMNVNAAVGSFMGLINGPLYRKYTFRQAACVAGFICFTAICALAFIKNVYGIYFFYSILHASGYSVVMSASALSLISYFTKKRRVAVGLSWVVSGLGNIVTPQVLTLLMSIYGSSGTIILFAGISLHTVVCAVLMQPVRMNAKRSTEFKNVKTVTKEYDEKSTGVVINGSKIILPAENVRYPHNNNEEHELESPLITSSKENWQICNVNSRTWKNTGDMKKNVQTEKTNISGNSDDIENHGHNGFEIVHENDDKLEYLLENGSMLAFQEDEDEDEDQIETELSWWSHAIRAIVAFFDLDLLRDYVCVNIIIGNSLIQTIEVNYVLLLPFILMDYGLTMSQTATIMSIAGIVDVVTRLIISVVTSRIRWENRTFLLIGVGLTLLGRTALAHANSYNMIFGVAIICGMGKGMCFIFSALVLPDHVSLKKLPAATGIQLMIGGMLFLVFGPIVGLLREISGSYTVPLHFLNMFSYYVIISKIIERRCCSSNRRRPEEINEARD